MARATAPQWGQRARISCHPTGTAAGNRGGAHCFRIVSQALARFPRGEGVIVVTTGWRPGQTRITLSTTVHLCAARMTPVRGENERSLERLALELTRKGEPPPLIGGYRKLRSRAGLG